MTIRDPQVVDMSRENLLLHIDGLQAALARRNARIAELESQDHRDAVREREKRRAYKQGWKDCANRLMNVTHQAANQLRTVREEALRAVLDGERLP